MASARNALVRAVSFDISECLMTSFVSVPARTVARKKSPSKINCRNGGFCAALTASSFAFAAVDEVNALSVAYVLWDGLAM